MRTTRLSHFSRLATATLVLMAMSNSFANADDSEGPKPDRLTVHEWGTFTVLQDESGTQLSGVNVDDEPLPGFVHHLPASTIVPTVLDSRYWYYRMKGVPRRHPQVTVRLETPVIYFYPPADQKSPLEVDVRAEFRGGWLTEFYPNAEIDIDGANLEEFDFSRLSTNTLGSLTWEKLKVGTTDRGPKTDEHVWLAPRETRAVPVTAANGEAESYVFYRGVGHFDAPLKVLLDRVSGHARFTSALPSDQSSPEPEAIPDVWLVHVHEDGRVAYRHLTEVRFDEQGAAKLDPVSFRFVDDDFDSQNLDRLRASMHASIVDQGLFEDEATAMLSTWQRAYFESPGLRVFFPVSRSWTDQRLALDLSVEADVERVMMCRVELISDIQSSVLSTLAMGPASDSKWLDEVKSPEKQNQLLSGRSLDDLSDLEMPDDFQRYLQLGRFRNALLIAEEKRTGSEELTKFIENYRLQAFRPPTEEGLTRPSR